MDLSGIYQAGQFSTSGAGPADLKSACRALEQEFARLVFGKMREAMVPRSSDGSNGFARDTTAALLDTQWAELASQGEGLGLWQSLCRQLERDAVKSSPREADQRTRTETFRKEAGHEPAANSRVLSARVEGAGIGAASGAYSGLPGVPGAQALLGARALLDGGEGK